MSKIVPNISEAIWRRARRTLMTWSKQSDGSWVRKHSKILEVPVLKSTYKSWGATLTSRTYTPQQLEAVSAREGKATVIHKQSGIHRHSIQVGTQQTNTKSCSNSFHWIARASLIKTVAVVRNKTINKTFWTLRAWVIIWKTFKQSKTCTILVFWTLCRARHIRARTSIEKRYKILTTGRTYHETRLQLLWLTDTLMLIKRSRVEVSNLEQRIIKLTRSREMMLCRKDHGRSNNDKIRSPISTSNSHSSLASIIRASRLKQCKTLNLTPTFPETTQLTKLHPEAVLAKT